jgi:ABC-2 type transport system permease protein
MSNSLRSLPGLIRVEFAVAIAFRVATFIWLLCETSPLVMLAVWTTVAKSEPIHGYGEHEFTIYFLWVFVVRQLTYTWLAWQLNEEVRDGTVAMRMLRPVQPLVTYVAENLGGLPLRILVCIPVLLFGFFTYGEGFVGARGGRLLLCAVAVLGGWALTMLFNLVLGCLTFFIENSRRLVDVWMALFFVLSGYLVPIEMFPPGLRAALDWLPFRYQVALPVELLMGLHDARDALVLIGRQWGLIAVMLFVLTMVWRSGVRRYSAFGG